MNRFRRFLDAGSESGILLLIAHETKFGFCQRHLNVVTLDYLYDLADGFAIG